MTKRMNKADSLVFKALQKAIAEDKVHICLINSKINVPGSPVYNPWEVLLPILCPVLLGLLIIWLVGILWGLVVMIAGIMLSSNFVKKKMEQRLWERAKKMLIRDYASCCDLWSFGGIVLIKTDDKKHGCLAPEGNWKDFVVLHFSDLMTEKSESSAETENEKAA